MDELIRLLNACSGTPYRTVLLCAGDVWEGLLAAGVPAAPADLAELGACDPSRAVVITAPGYAPGRWKLIQHDHCCPTGELTCLLLSAATHLECTVLGERRG